MMEWQEILEAVLFFVEICQSDHGSYEPACLPVRHDGRGQSSCCNHMDVSMDCGWITQLDSSHSDYEGLLRLILLKSSGLIYL